jgi:hypothetical protein
MCRNMTNVQKCAAVEEDASDVISNACMPVENFQHIM